jgi:hypothetical protein
MIMVKRTRWSVEPRGGGTWAVQRHGSSRADSLHETKQAAISRAVRLCRRDRGDLYVKNLAGAIDDARSYGHVYGGRREQPGGFQHVRAATRTATRDGTRRRER